MNNAGLNIPRGVIDTLIGLQQEDGGWEYTTGLGTSPDNTALAIQALLAAGIPKEEESIVKAINFLHSKQTPDGGWGDSSTTAFTLMALNALDEPLEIWKTPTKRDPLHALFSFQKPNGAFVYNWEMPDDNLMSTTAALLAIYDGYYDLPARDVTPNNKAAIVIVPGIEKVYVDCVEFENSSISGLELLQLSNFDYDNSEVYISSIMDLLTTMVRPIIGLTGPGMVVSGFSTTLGQMTQLSIRGRYKPGISQAGNNFPVCRPALCLTLTKSGRTIF